MSTAEMKLDLIRKIDSLDDWQLKDAHSFFKYQFNNDDDSDEWDEPFPFSEIKASIRQIENGEGIPLKNAMADLRNKYGLNG